jgi:hypothetical protein
VPIIPPAILVAELSEMDPLDHYEGSCFFCGAHNQRVEAKLLATRIKAHSISCLWRNAHDFLAKNPQYVRRFLPNP